MNRETNDVTITEAYIQGDELYIDLWYPDEEDAIKRLVIGLTADRYARDIRISYNMIRDVWVIECADEGDFGEPNWNEVACIPARNGKDERTA